MGRSAGAAPGVGQTAKSAAKIGLAVCAGLTLANCAQQRMAGYSAQERREIGAFSQARYGRASERVVADGQPAPKGGGRDLVGRPYRVAGRTYVPYEFRAGHTEVGASSWYGVAFHGRRTANGEVFDRMSISAAHRTMPLPSYARVSNLTNGRSIVVRVNDRGPYHGGRIMDVSQRVADLLDFRAAGSGRVKVEYLGRASLAGSDDRKLVATLRTDGSTGPLPDGFGGQSRVMVASLDEGGQSYPESGSGFGLFSTPPSATVRAAAPVPVAVTPEVAPAPPGPAPAPVVTAFASPPTRAEAPPQGAPVSLPLPPERPFDLGTIPNAGTPVMTAVPAVAPAANPPPPPARPRLASAGHLFYAEPSPVLMRFAQADPFAAMKPQTFRALRAADGER